jgi:hypothetical protein
MRRLLAILLPLLLPAPALALILDSGDGLQNTSAPADDPGWAHVGRVDGPTGVYLGNGWVITAAHVPSTSTSFQGVNYPVVQGSDVILVNPDDSYADLRVFRIDPSPPSLGLLEIRATTPAMNANVTMIGRGVWRGAATSWMGIDGWLWGVTVGVMRWGTNRVAGSEDVGTLAFTTSFTKYDQGGTAQEAQGAIGDSGGAVFIKNGSVWELAGVMIAVGSYVNQPSGTALYGNLTYAADLSQYRDQIIAVTRPECSNEADDDGDTLVDWPDDPQCSSALDDTELPDQDGDGVGDPLDNCLAEGNPDQRDTNQDGYGNLCDADFDDDGGVGLADFATFKLSFGQSLGSPAYDPDADFDGDGAVGLFDFGVFRSLFGAPPGPSGLSCAGTIPCP